MKRVSVILVFCLLVLSMSFVVAAEGVDSSRGSDKVCCQYPGPADGAMYEWRAESECQSPEDVLWGDKVVDDDFCEDESKLKECRDKCKSNLDNEDERSKCISGCKSDFGFVEDDLNYRCEDMTQEHCELAEECEGIFGSSLCEGDTCTADMAWKGCRYEGDEFFEEYEDEELKQDAGTSPGDTFYFIDKFFDKFGDQLEVKEERIAEIKEMVEAGDIEGAKIALEEYMKLAEEIEHEIDPERKEEAKRSAAVIRATMKDIRDKLPEGERGKFVSEIMSKEHSIATSVEISSKIKALCVQLAELDPLEYSKMCRTDDDAPKWKKKLDKDLSAEQEKIAREFVDVMKNCFKSSGQDCNCEAIPFYDFSIACSKAAPLAMACDIDGDEIACDELDNLDMPELPEWLEPIWKDLEMGMNEAQYDMHMPPECVEAGVTNPKECGRIMIKEHAPLECRAALLAADASSENEGREICDKIMFEQHAPQECIDKGITDPEECAKFMNNFRGHGGPMDGEGGFRKGPDCGKIENPTERLDCYDNKGNEMGDYYGPGPGGEGQGEITWQCKENRIHWAPDCETFMREEWPDQERMKMEEGDMRRQQEGDWRAMEKECALRCEKEGKPWDYYGGECVCKERDYEDYYKADPIEFGGPDYSGGSGCDDCSSQCPAGANTDCVNSRCVCGDVPDTGPQYAEGEGPGEPEDYYQEPSSIDSGGDGGIMIEPETSPEPESSPEPASEPEPEPAPVTGNAFLNYYNK